MKRFFFKLLITVLLSMVVLVSMFITVQAATVDNPIVGTYNANIRVYTITYVYGGSLTQDKLDATLRGQPGPVNSIVFQAGISASNPLTFNVPVTLGNNASIYGTTNSRITFNAGVTTVAGTNSSLQYCTINGGLTLNNGVNRTVSLYYCDVNSDVTITNGTILAAGAAANTLTIRGNLTLRNSGFTCNYVLLNNPAVTVTGNMSVVVDDGLPNNATLQLGGIRTHGDFTFQHTGTRNCPVYNLHVDVRGNANVSTTGTVGSATMNVYKTARIKGVGSLNIGGVYTLASLTGCNYLNLYGKCTLNGEVSVGQLNFQNNSVLCGGPMQFNFTNASGNFGVETTQNITLHPANTAGVTINAAPSARCRLTILGSSRDHLLTLPAALYANATDLTINNCKVNIPYTATTGAGTLNLINSNVTLTGSAPNADSVSFGRALSLTNSTFETAVVKSSSSSSSGGGGKRPGVGSTTGGDTCSCYVTSSSANYVAVLLNSKVQVDSNSTLRVSGFTVTSAFDIKGTLAAGAGHTSSVTGHTCNNAGMRNYAYTSYLPVTISSATGLQPGCKLSCAGTTITVNTTSHLTRIAITGNLVINHPSEVTECSIEACTFNAPTTIVGSNSTATLTFSDGAYGSTIDRGSFTGAPAVNGKSNVTVTRGVFTDNSGVSSFLVHLDSEASKNNNVTTVKLSNPPVVIDWGEFPGINLDLDLAAPTISVRRNPKSLTAPTRQVVFTITASDPARGTDENGNPNPPGKAYISVNGDEWRESPVTVTITEPGPVTILARDDAGNVREFTTEVKNIDVEAPEILGFTQSSTAWTRNAVTVTVNATDDVKLNNTPYRWTFTPNDGSGKVVGNWTSSKSFKATKNGKLSVEVRDASDASNPKITKSDDYWINNIDITAPTATHVTDPASGKVSKDAGVTVSVSINDVMDPVTLDSSGISNLPIQWWQGATPNTPWTDEVSRTFHANETWYYRVKDALGNISPTYTVNINQVSTTAPTITSLTGPFMNQPYVTSPTTLTVNAVAGAGSTLAPKPYSWDGGKTWTSINTLNVYSNGEYTVLVRDNIGNITEASAIIPNIDASQPTTNVYLYKGAPADDPTITDPLDFVWKLKVEANDDGAGIDYIETLWDGGHHSTSPVIVDITEPGVYGVIVHDKAGNQTYVEKVITAEQLGDAYTGAGGNNQYVGITTPSDGSATAGEPFNAPLQDLVFGPDGAYNTKTGQFTQYLPGQKGITANFTVNGKRGTWLTGTGTFANQTQNVKFGDTKVEKIAGGRDIKASVFFPFQYDADGKMTWPGDVKNGRIKIVIKEWKDEACTQLNREGSATLYTSVQASDPVLTYSYDKATGEVTVLASSAVGGIDTITVDKGDGNGPQTLTGNPATFSVSGLPNGTTITIKATDTLGNTTTITKTVDNLGTNGSAGGSLSVTDMDDPTNAGKILGENGNTPNSYHISNRAAEIYIINGTRSNTSSIPNVGGSSTPAAPAPTPGS